MKLISNLMLLMTIAFYAMTSWAQRPPQIQNRFTTTAHVTASQWLYRLNTEPLPAVSTLRLSAVIDNKRYELDTDTRNSTWVLLRLGDYPAALKYHPLGNTGEFTEKCLMKMPDGKVMKFTVTGISELSAHSPAPSTH